MFYPIPPLNSSGKSEIAYWENFLSDEDINLILNQPEWNSLAPGGIGGSFNGAVNTDIRRSKINWLSLKPELMPIWEKLAFTVARVNSQFFKFNLSGFHEPMQISIYTEHDQGCYNWHTDASATDLHVPRKLSLSMLLSDPSEFSGGAFEVKTTSDTVQTLECRKGRAWFFSSYTLHRVAPVTKGVRKSLVLWIGGPEFK